MSHRPPTELQNKLDQAKTEVAIGSLYIHHKYPSKRYLVIDIGIQEANEKVCVIYCDTTMPTIHFVRDLGSWFPRFTITS
jgi:hypothetical protein